jgi:MazG family protein
MDLSGVEKFLRTIHALRDPRSGCPWDLAQTHESLEKYFHEELHEFLEALKVEGPSSPKTWEELGDVLLQVALHAELASEKGYADFNEICRAAAEKIISRHPHVFDPEFPRFKTPDEVSRAWEQIKAHARKTAMPLGSHQALPPGLPSVPSSEPGDQVQSVPKSLPALLRASRMGEKAASFGFDWNNAADVLAKVHEEVAELEADLNHEARAQEEWGDLVFALGQYARKRKWDPEQLLHRANEKFGARFAALDRRLHEQGLRWEDLDIETLEQHWQAIK